VLRPPAPVARVAYERARLSARPTHTSTDGEVTIAWTIAQQVMRLYQLDDPTQARVQVAELTAALRDWPISELVCLGRTLHAWDDELAAYFDHPAVSNGPTKNLNLKIKNTKRIAAATATSPTTLIPTGRISTPGPTPGVDLWWSGKHRHHGGNIQELSAPDDWPLWTWGFGTREELLAAGAVAIADTVDELGSLLQSPLHRSPVHLGNAQTWAFVCRGSPRSDPWLEIARPSPVATSDSGSRAGPRSRFPLTNPVD
jgi:hypothetical protein